MVAIPDSTEYVELALFPVFVCGSMFRKDRLTYTSVN